MLFFFFSRVNKGCIIPLESMQTESRERTTGKFSEPNDVVPFSGVFAESILATTEALRAFYSNCSL